MKRIWAIIPIILLLGLALLGGVKLAGGKGDGFGKSDGRPAPTRSFERLGGGEPLQFASSEDSRPRVVNLFASWCVPCRVEHPLLMELGRRHPDQIFGLLYEDTPEAGTRFLTQLGDPYTAIGLDQNGQGGLDFGLTGVPETFVIMPDGQIVLHVRGPLSPKMVDEISDLLGSG